MKVQYFVEFCVIVHPLNSQHCNRMKIAKVVLQTICKCQYSFCPAESNINGSFGFSPIQKAKYISYCVYTYIAPAYFPYFE
jgi:hypothetical protein